jgi:hypothetical protein
MATPAFPEGPELAVAVSRPSAFCGNRKGGFVPKALVVGALGVVGLVLAERAADLILGRPMAT